MATAAAPPPAPSLSWATFALTETRWLVHALGWSVVLWAALLYLPWLFYGGGVLHWLFFGFGAVVELAILAALATAYTARETPAPPPSTVMRYALVDAPFVALAAPWIIVPVHAALAVSGLVPLVGGHGPPPVLPIGVFVFAFYASLGAIGHARSRAGAARQVPLGVAFAVVALLAVQSYGPALEHFRLQAERAGGVAKYERATGKALDELDQLRIGNSLHGFDNRVGPIQLDARGRLLVGGGFSYYAGRDARGLVRLTPEGQLDTSYARMPQGDPYLLAPDRMRLADDGALVVYRPRHGGLARLNEDGTVDAGFRPDLASNAVEKQATEHFDVGPNGSVVIVSPTRWATDPQERCIRKFDRAGIRDPAFEAAAMQALFGTPTRDSGLMCNVSSIDVLADGRVLVGGNFPVDGHLAGVVRLNADGTRDESFRAGKAFSNVSMWRFAPDGALFLVSYLPVADSKPVAYQAKLVKLLASGEVDASFAVPAGTINRVEAMALQPDGRLVLAGSRGLRDYGTLIRLNPDGRVDPTFGGASGLPRVDGMVTSLMVQPDGRIVAGGEFREYHHGKTKVDRHNIVRMLADGSLDTQFEPR